MENVYNEQKEIMKLHEILKNKGDYLFFEGNELFLMENNIAKKVKFISLKPEENWENIKFGDDYYILSFDLKENDLTEDMGNKILDFLNHLKKQNIRFRISRALPRSIFGSKHISAFSEFNIPNSCKDCLELFKISRKGNTILCNGNKLIGFKFTKKGREQIYDYLKILFNEEIIIQNPNKRFEFKLLNVLNCASPKRGIMDKFIDFDFVAYWISKKGWHPDKNLFIKLLEYKDTLSKGMMLDNGGAHGRDSFLLKRRGLDVILTDINPAFFKYTKKRQNERNIFFPIIASDSRALPFKDNSFVGVFSGGVMHHEMHIEDVKIYLKESYRVLMHGGLFFGSVWAYWDFGTPPEPRLLQMRDKSLFESLLQEVGFNIIGGIEEYTPSYEPHKHAWLFACMKPQ